MVTQIQLKTSRNVSNVVKWKCICQSCTMSSGNDWENSGRLSVKNILNRPDIEFTDLSYLPVHSSVLESRPRLDLSSITNLCDGPTLLGLQGIIVTVRQVWESWAAETWHSGVSSQNLLWRILKPLWRQNRPQTPPTHTKKCWCIGSQGLWQRAAHHWLVQTFLTSPGKLYLYNSRPQCADCRGGFSQFGTRCPAATRGGRGVVKGLNEIAHKWPFSVSAAQPQNYV